MRSLRTLREVSFIAAEDTRHTRKLLTHFDIHPTNFFSYHEHNMRAAGDRIVSLLQDGQSGALVSDAGMPGISDPGQDVVHRLIELNLSFTVLPGASAGLTALVGSGLDAHAFSFFGFLERSGTKRKLQLAALKTRPETMIFYEAPHRVAQMLSDALEVLGEHRVVVIARELSKIHEEYVRFPLADHQEIISRGIERGELVVLISGYTEASDERSESEGVPYQGVPSAKEVALRVARYTETGLPPKEAMRSVAKDLHISRREVYQMLLLLSEEDDT